MNKERRLSIGKQQEILKESEKRKSIGARRIGLRTEEKEKDEKKQE